MPHLAGAESATRPRTHQQFGNENLRKKMHVAFNIRAPCEVATWLPQAEDDENDCRLDEPFAILTVLAVEDRGRGRPARQRVKVAPKVWPNSPKLAEIRA